MINMKTLIRIFFVVFIVNGIDCLGRVCDNCCDCFKDKKIEETREFEEVGDYSNFQFTDILNGVWLTKRSGYISINIFKKKEANSISSTVKKNNISIKLVGEDSSKIEVPKLEKSRDSLKMQGKRYAFFKIKTEKENTVYLYCSNVESVVGTSGTWGIFSETNHKEISVIACDTECVYNIAYMFANCNNLTELNLTKLNTKEVVCMDGMFYGCDNLEKLKFGKNFNTSKVESMQEMFSLCYNLEYLDIKNFDTSGVKDMEKMFFWCILLKKIRLGQNFNMGNVKFFNYMFKGCISFPEGIKDKLDNPQEVVAFFKKN